VDHLARGFQIGALAEIVAAEADGGHAQAGAAEIANLHGSILWGWHERAAIVARVPVARKARSYRDWRRAMQQKSMQKKEKMRPRSDAATDREPLGA
jgi:hypothetical protein